MTDDPNQVNNLASILRAKNHGYSATFRAAVKTGPVQQNRTHPVNLAMQDRSPTHGPDHASSLPSVVTFNHRAQATNVEPCTRTDRMTIKKMMLKIRWEFSIP